VIFLSYDFICFSLAFFAAYALIGRWPQARLALLILAGLWFQLFYGGVQSLSVAFALALVAYAAGLSKSRPILIAAILICIATLVFYKYTLFLSHNVLGIFIPSGLEEAISASAPAAIPLGISFFVFEFVHYLVDVYRGHKPTTGLRDFATFGFFWPTMISGPIKRYEQFIPAVHHGIKGQTVVDAMFGLIRVAIGFLKKWAADNLTGWIDYYEPQLAFHPLGSRWIFLFALSARILLDFSGYSDMAIGYARIVGIRVPENFNWPYLARSPIEFWQRWHMSLSSWIRDYIYIPLGGNRLGTSRRIANALAAMVICGLWHGAAWNFAVWGLYHGIGLALTAGVQRTLPNVERNGVVVIAFGWMTTNVFVAVGWLLFFYPLDKAWSIVKLLVPGVGL
jgi:alginate O-acetyltransferase complex protein AlgI